MVDSCTGIRQLVEGYSEVSYTTQDSFDKPQEFESIYSIKSQQLQIDASEALL